MNPLYPYHTPMNMKNKMTPNTAKGTHQSPITIPSANTAPEAMVALAPFINIRIRSTIVTNRQPKRNSNISHTSINIYFTYLQYIIRGV